MAGENSLIATLRTKRVEIEGLLKNSGHPTDTFQYHLDKGSLENIYWHRGYVDALIDVERLLLHREAAKPAYGQGVATAPRAPAAPKAPAAPTVEAPPSAPAPRRATRPARVTPSASGGLAPKADGTAQES